MIVDTSAIVSILRREEGSTELALALAQAQFATISAGSWIELAAVATRSGRAHLWDDAEQLMRDTPIVVAPVTIEQAEIARDAYRRYGMGTGHPAKLNFGDCFAYALAKSSGEPLLFKGGDFAQTDVARALPA